MNMNLVASFIIIDIILHFLMRFDSFYAIYS